ncbi:NHL domain-containing protein [Arcicella rigui]|uniref:Ig domain-containing protein n=1 Tax=Arcicella rigui TaxID=797020 RepID=A0ABU5QDZ2_9BACT|nr:putative Ig domain-containing protein [Arcicella rigui]MEA5140589.1 putative Ig domain-containing protein [Arcicella rigui]
MLLLVNTQSSFSQAPQISYESPKIFTVGTPITPLKLNNKGGAIPKAFYGQMFTTNLKTDFGNVNAMVMDSAKNLYFSDSPKSLIRKLSNTGVLNVVAGNGLSGAVDGQSTAAKFYSPQGLAIDANKNIYVADAYNNSIRKISPNGIVNTLAGNSVAGSTNGTGTKASFNFPQGVAVDASGNVYVADYNNHLIRKITPSGVVTTFAGSGKAGLVNGTGTAASFNYPKRLVFDATGNLLVVDEYNHAIRKITPTGVVSTIAGNGTSGFKDATGTDANFNQPQDIAIDALGNIYVADGYNYAIRKITPTGIVSTFAGNGVNGYREGIGTNAGLYQPYGLCLDGTGNLLVSWQTFSQIGLQKISTVGYSISPALPAGLVFDENTGTISGTPMLAKAATTYTITAYNLSGVSSTNLTLTITGSIPVKTPTVKAPAIKYPTPKTFPVGASISPILSNNTGGAIPKGYSGQVSTYKKNLNYTNGIAMDTVRNIIYYIERNYIKKISPSGEISILAGSTFSGANDGEGSEASFNQPSGLTVDASGNVYVADIYNQKVRKITPSGTVTTFAGTGNAGFLNGSTDKASFNYPCDVAFDSFGVLYVADKNNKAIRKITATGIVSTMSENKTPFFSPDALSVDALGNVFVVNSDYHTIYKVTPDGEVTNLAGKSGYSGFVDGVGTNALFYYPSDIVVDNSGNVFITDNSNHAIRKISQTGEVITLAGNGQNAYNKDGVGAIALFNLPRDLCIDASGNLWVTDNTGIRKVSTMGYSPVTPKLPVGLLFDETTGNITGIPTLANPATDYRVTAYNAGGQSTSTFNITVTGTLPAKTPAVKAPVISYPTPKTYSAGTAISPLVLANSGGAIPNNFYGQTSTLVENVNVSGDIIVDTVRNIVYFIDGHTIKKISTSNVVSVFAGSSVSGNTNGQGTEASFNQPQGLTIDVNGNLYVADTYNHLIRKITPAGTVSTFAGTGEAGKANGITSKAVFSSPSSVTIDGFGNVYVLDNGNYVIRKISTTGIVEDLTAADNSLSNCTKLIVGYTGDLFVVDRNNHSVRGITPNGIIYTLAGGEKADYYSSNSGYVDGFGTDARFNYPSGITIDAQMNIYVADKYNNSIRKISLMAVTTVAGNGMSNSVDGIGTDARFYYPTNIAMDGKGYLYVAENNKIRKVAVTGYSNITPKLPSGLSFDENTGTISGTPTLAKAATDYSLTAYNLGGNSKTTFNIAVTGTVSPKPNLVKAPSITYPTPKTFTAGTNISPLIPTNTGGAIPKELYGQTINFTEKSYQVSGIVKDTVRGFTYFVEGNKIKKINASGSVSTFAGSSNVGANDGQGTEASFYEPKGLAIDANGNVYVADATNNLIRKITPSGLVSTFAGNGQAGFTNGNALKSSFSSPVAICIDTYGNFYITDKNNHAIRKINTRGIVSTLAGGNIGYNDGTDLNAAFYYPSGITVDANGNVYVADTYNHRIRKITAEGVVTTLAGNSSNTLGDGTGTGASFNYPTALVADATGNIYVADQNNNAIRKITPSGVVTTLAGNGNGFILNGVGNIASFYPPSSITIDEKGYLLVGSSYGSPIRKVSTVGYSNITPSLPSGLAFDESTGNISGIPTTAQVATNYSITGYNLGGSSTANFSITVTGTATTPNAIAAPIISYATPQTYVAGTSITPLVPKNTGGTVPATPYGQVSTFAGNSTTGANNGISSNASFSKPNAIAVDVFGNTYVADYGNGLIRKISPSGIVSTLAGKPQIDAASYFNGTGSEATFFKPVGIAVDKSGNVYVTEENSHAIRKITPSGVVTTFAGDVFESNSTDGTGPSARFNAPKGLAVDASGNVFVADYNNHKIRKITASGEVSTFAGNGSAGIINGTGTGASFYYPKGVAVDKDGNVYVTEGAEDHNAIRKITKDQVVSILAGGPYTGNIDGRGTVASFNLPYGISVDKLGNVYVADWGNNIIRKILPDGTVSTLAGNYNVGIVNGNGIKARFSLPKGICVDGQDYLLVADTDNNLIRKISLSGYSSNDLPAGLTLDPSTGIITGKPTTPQTATNYTITAINGGGIRTTNVNITITGNLVTPTITLPKAPVISYPSPKTYSVGTPMTAFLNNTGGAIPNEFYGNTNTFYAGYNTKGFAVDTVQNILYFIDNSSIRKIENGNDKIVAGSFEGATGLTDGQGTEARFNQPQGLTIDTKGNLYVADLGNHAIRKITPSGLVSTFAGSGNNGFQNGTGTAARFTYPSDITIDVYGNLYVTEIGNNSVRKITPAGVVTTLAGNGSVGYNNGTGSNATFSSPAGITVDLLGNIYVADQFNNVIRKITSTGVVTTLVGNGSAGYLDGTGSNARLNSPQKIVADAIGNVYFTQSYSHSVRKVSTSGVVTTLAGDDTSYGSLDAIGTDARFYGPSAISIDKNGYLIVNDNYGFKKVSTIGYSLFTPALPQELSFDASTGSISGTPLVAKTASNYTLTAYNRGGSSSTTFNMTFTGTIPVKTPSVKAPIIKYPSPKTYPVGTNISPLALGNTGGLIPKDYYGQTSTIMEGLDMREGIIVDTTRNITYFIDDHQIKKISASGKISVLAGNMSYGFADGEGDNAYFNSPTSLALDANGNIYVCDLGNHIIRKVTPDGIVSTYAGRGSIGFVNGNKVNSNFNYPTGISLDNYGNLYVADKNNHVIRKISASGIVSTFAGNGTDGFKNGSSTEAQFSYPAGVVVGLGGNLYVADKNNHVIRKIAPDGTVSTFAGNGTAAYIDGKGTAASFSNPEELTIDAIGNLYVADFYSHTIRKITPDGTVSTLAGNGTYGYINGIGKDARFSNPASIAIDNKGYLFIGDSNGARKVSTVGYTTITPDLPAGLIFDESTGNITGIPLLAKTATNYNITAYNVGGSSTTTFNIATTGTIPTQTSTVKAPAIQYQSPKTYPIGTAITPLQQTNTGGAITKDFYGRTDIYYKYVRARKGIAIDSVRKLTYYIDEHNIQKISSAKVVSTLAGNGTRGNADGQGTEASFNLPEGLAIDMNGNLYVADAENNRIRKITPAGVVTTLAGNGTAGKQDGIASSASFKFPSGVVVDRFGNVYVADQRNHAIRKISPTGIVTTLAGGEEGFADGKGTLAKFSNPVKLAIDGNLNVLVVDKGNHSIRKITPDGTVSTLAGNGYAGTDNGTGVTARFYNPDDIAIDALGNLYITESSNHVIRKVTPTGVVTNFVGDGTAATVDGVGTTARFYYPSKIGIDAQGYLYVGDDLDLGIRTVSTGGYNISPTLPTGLEFDENTGSISGIPLVAQAATNYTITAYNTGGSSSSTVNITLTGTIPVKQPTAKAPIISYETPKSYVAGASISPLSPKNSGGAIPQVAFGQVSSLILKQDYPGYYPPQGIAYDSIRKVIYITGGNVIYKINEAGYYSQFAGNNSQPGNTNGQGIEASFYNPQGLALDASGNLYVADAGNNLIRKITPSGLVSTLAGNGSAGLSNGKASNATFNGPSSIALDNFGNVYVADYYNHVIRKISSTGTVSTFAGSGNRGFKDGTGTDAELYNPIGITVDANGNVIVSESGNNAIRKITPAGIVSTLAGSGNQTYQDGKGKEASFYYPQQLTADSFGNIYVCDYYNHVIRKITADGVVSTLAGNRTDGSRDGIGTQAVLSYPKNITIDNKGYIIITDASNVNRCIKKVATVGYAMTDVLPDGLIFDASSGSISGIPLKATAAKNYAITAYNSGGSSSTTVNIAVTGTATPPATPTLPAITYPTPKVYNIGVNIPVLQATNKGGIVPSGIFKSTSTYAGNGSIGRVNGAAKDATFQLDYDFTGIVTDPYNNSYVVDAGNTIRRISASGIVSPFPTPVQYGYITDIAVDRSSSIYFANNTLIQKITPSGTVSTVADLSSTNSYTMKIAIDKNNNLYVADVNNYKILKITSAGVVSTLAGSGYYGWVDSTGTAAGFERITSITTDPSNNIYVTENNKVRKISPTGVVTTIAGGNYSGFADGQGSLASFSNLTGICSDIKGNLYVTDKGNHLIRKISTGGLVSTIAGSGNSGFINGVGTESVFNNPQAISIDNFGNLLVVDRGNNVIRKINLTGYTINPALPNGLNFDESTGNISGISKVLSPATNYTVTAYNGAGPATTTVNIAIIPKSNNANLKSIVLSNGTLSPAFDSLKVNYTANVSNAISSINVSAIVSNINASLSINGVATNAATIPLKEGDNNIVFTVLAQDGKTTKTYSIKFIRAATQTITFNPLTPVTYGSADISLGAVSTNATIPITYSSSDTTVAKIVSGKIRVFKVGTATITASQTGSLYYDIAKNVSQSLTVNPAIVTITADNKSKVVGTANPTLTFTMKGFVNTETQSVLTSQPTISTTATNNSVVGAYPITVSGASAKNYTFNYVNATLTVTPTVPVITANNASICQGSSATLTASACAGGTLTWTGGLTGTSITVSPTTTKAYKALCTINGFKSDSSTAMTITVLVKPATPTIASNNASICLGTSAILTATGCAGTVTWTGGLTGNSVTVTPTKTTAYKAICTINACRSDSSLVTTITVTPKPATPTVKSNNASICLGTSAVLTATGCAGTVTWTGGLTGNSVTVTPTKTTAYKALCTVNACKSDSSLVTTITVTPKPATPTVASNNGSICLGNIAVLTATGCSGTVSWTGGLTGNSVTVTPTKTTAYKALCTINTCKGDSSTATTITVNPKPATPTIASNNASICLGNIAVLTATGCTGTVTWTGGLTGSSVTVTPTKTTTYKALCTVNACKSDSSLVTTITVTPKPVTPTVASNNASICLGTSAILTATGCAGTVSWTGGLTGSSVTVAPTKTTAYKALCTVNACKSDSSLVTTITVTPKPATPTVASNNASICLGTSAVLTATGCAGTVSWTGGLTGSSVTVTPTKTTAYKALCTVNACKSDSSLVTTITVTPKPVTPTVASNNASICLGTSAVLTATGCSGTVSWTGGLTGNSVTVTPTKTTAYKALCTVNACKSDSSLVTTITVNPKPATPTVASNNTSICLGTSAVLTATGCSGTVSWTGGLTGSSVTVTPTKTTTYKALCTVNACKSDSSLVTTITVTPKPATPTIASNNASICLGTSAVLTATGCSGTVTWTGGLTGSSVTVTPTKTTTYKALCTVNACRSDSSLVTTITVNPKPTTPTVASNNASICLGTSAVLTATGCAGTVSWTGGLTGNSVTVTPTKTTAYKALCTINACKSDSSLVTTITVNPKPATPTVKSNNASICLGTSAILTATGCSGTVTWTGGLTGNSVTVTPNKTTAYKALCTINACKSDSSLVTTITVNPKPATPTVKSNNASICLGTSAILTATGCSGTVSWTGGLTGSSVTVTPTKTTTYKALCTINACKSDSSLVATITVLSKPSTPTVTRNNATICAGSSATLTASACAGGTVNWTGGLTGIAITVSPSKTTAYRAICSQNGCKSDSSAITYITVNPKPTAPTIKSNIVCVTCSPDNLPASAKPTLTASGCSGSIKWSNGATTSSITVSPTVATTYTATCTVNGCISAASNAIKVSPEILTTGTTSPIQAAKTVREEIIQTEPSLGFKVFPNPATNEINIETDLEGESTFQLYNSIGQKVLETNFVKKTKISISDIGRGNHFYLIQNQELRSTGKILLE